MVATLLLGAWVTSMVWSPRPGATIDDAAFVTAADRLCAATLPKLRAPEDAEPSNDDREEETAAEVERAADGIDALVVKLGSLDRKPASSPEVESWLRSWGAYAAAGRRYAAAVRRGNPMEYGAVDDESKAPLKAIVAFSRGNRIDACIP